MIERWFRRKEGGKPPPESAILQMAIKLGKLPDEIEQMDSYWFNRMLIYMQGESDSQGE